MPLTMLDPLTRGSMVHEMLAEIMRELIASGWVPLTDDRLGAAHGVADAIVTRLAAEYEDRLTPPILRVWQDAVAAIRRDVHEWVRRLPGDGMQWTPTGVEIGVGLHRRFRPSTRPAGARKRCCPMAPACTAWSICSSAASGDQWRITDYKTGKYRLSDNVVVNGGRTLQPILYAMAVEAVFAGRVTASRLYYCTDDGGYEDHPWAITGAVGDQTRKAGLEVLAIIDHAIEEGGFPRPRPKRRARGAISAPSAVRRAARAGRKDHRPLAELTQLRRMK